MSEEKEKIRTLFSIRMATAWDDYKALPGSQRVRFAKAVAHLIDNIDHDTRLFYRRHYYRVGPRLVISGFLVGALFGYLLNVIVELVAGLL